MEPDSGEWWKDQAERYRAEVDQVTTDARALVGLHAEALATARAETAASAQARIQAEAEAEALRAALVIHRQTLGDILATIGPTLAKISQLLT